MSYLKNLIRRSKTLNISGMVQPRIGSRFENKSSDLEIAETNHSQEPINGDQKTESIQTAAPAPKVSSVINEPRPPLKVDAFEEIETKQSPFMSKPTAEAVNIPVTEPSTTTLNQSTAEKNGPDTLPIKTIVLPKQDEGIARLTRGSRPLMTSNNKENKTHERQASKNLKVSSEPFESGIIKSDRVLGSRMTRRLFADEQPRQEQQTSLAHGEKRVERHSLKEVPRASIKPNPDTAFQVTEAKPLAQPKPSLSPQHRHVVEKPEAIPTINVTIGRVEVRAVQQSASKPKPRARPASAKMSLADYLKKSYRE